jgi:ribosomal protein L22
MIKKLKIVKGISLPISTKTSTAICKFIKGKNIQKATSDLEQVASHKKPVPMKGEIPHRKGKIMSGRYPKKASEYFIKLLNSLQANANVNGLENPIITGAISNIASQPYGRFGRVRRKRSHIKIIVKEKKVRETK